MIPTWLQERIGTPSADTRRALVAVADWLDGEAPYFEDTGGMPPSHGKDIREFLAKVPGE